MYVEISTAKTSATVYTHDRTKLVSGIKERAGERQVALEKPVLSLENAGKVKSAGLG